MTSPLCAEQFDLVLFMGVLYHLRYPLLALDLIRTHVAGDMLICQSLQRGNAAVADIADDYPFDETAVFDEPGAPRMQFVEHRFPVIRPTGRITVLHRGHVAQRGLSHRVPQRHGQLYLPSRRSGPVREAASPALRPVSNPWCKFGVPRAAEKSWDTIRQCALVSQLAAPKPAAVNPRTRDTPHAVRVLNGPL